MTDARRPLISGNWKMHHTHLDAIQVVQKLAFRLDARDYVDVDVSLHPAFSSPGPAAQPLATGGS